MIFFFHFIIFNLLQSSMSFLNFHSFFRSSSISIIEYFYWQSHLSVLFFFHLTLFVFFPKHWNVLLTLPDDGVALFVSLCLDPFISVIEGEQRERLCSECADVGHVIHKHLPITEHSLREFVVRRHTFDVISRQILKLATRQEFFDGDAKVFRESGAHHLKDRKSAWIQFFIGFEDCVVKGWIAMDVLLRKWTFPWEKIRKINFRNPAMYKIQTCLWFSKIYTFFL